jgi:Fe-S-cluster-containing hydrogenase component 2
MLSTDPSRCAGCRTYEVACSHYKEGLCSPHLPRTRAIKFKETGRKIPTVCSQRRKPQCMAACPRIQMGLNPIKSQAFKCDLCNGDPQCARFYP